MRWILALFALFGTAAHAQSELEISLLTFGPGEVYWERFGHNAIVVRDRNTGEAVSYNYGIFDFDEDDFFVNFARGRMTYQIAANRAEDDIGWYAEGGRFVVEQKLRFDAAQARALKEFLDWNLRPENIRYRYDYYLSNCSTRVRDALDQSLGGLLRKQLASPSHGYTYRILTDALTRPQPLLMGALDAGLGPFADRRLSFWDDSFVPMELMAHLRHVTVVGADGAELPLVVEERVISPARTTEAAPVAPDMRWPFLGVGLTLGALLFFLGGQRARAGARRAFSILAIMISLICGFTGLTLLALWGFTEHQSAWRNENLFVLSPLCLLLIPAWWQAARVEWTPSRFACTLSLAIALLAGFALFAKVLPWFAQANLPWILLLLPVHAALAFVARRTHVHP